VGTVRLACEIVGLLERILARFYAGLLCRVLVESPKDHLRLRFYFGELCLDLGEVSIFISHIKPVNAVSGLFTCSSSTEAASMSPVESGVSVLPVHANSWTYIPSNRAICVDLTILIHCTGV